MATRLLPAIQQIFSNIGEIGIGFRIKTFATLTTTPLATYSDEALTIPNANPAIGAISGNQVSDGNGRFGDMWVASLKNYKIVLVDENDVVIDTIDPVDGGSSDSIITFDPMPEAFWGVSLGSASAYVLDSNVDISTIGYKDTQIFEMQFHIPNVAAPTLAIDGLPALNLKKYNGAGVKVDLEADDVVNQTYCLRNDGVDLIVLNPQKPFLDSRNLSLATETIAGISKIATQAETAAAVNDTKFITPLKLQGAFNNKNFIDAAIRFNAGVSPTILASKNISSLTRIGSGNYRLNFTTPMPNANYYVTAVCQQTSFTPMIGIISALTTSLEIKCEKWDSASFTSYPDLSNISILIFKS